MRDPCIGKKQLGPSCLVIFKHVYRQEWTPYISRLYGKPEKKKIKKESAERESQNHKSPRKMSAVVKLVSPFNMGFFYSVTHNIALVYFPCFLLKHATY